MKIKFTISNSDSACIRMWKTVFKVIVISGLNVIQVKLQDVLIYSYKQLLILGYFRPEDTGYSRDNICWCNPF